MNTTSTKQLSAPQRAKIAAQCDAVQSAAAALSFQWATIKSYRGWSARYAAWLCLHAPADLHSAAPVSWPCCGRRVWGFRSGLAWLLSQGAQGLEGGAGDMRRVATIRANSLPVL